MPRPRPFSPKQQAASLILDQLDPFAGWLYRYHSGFEWGVKHLQYVRRQLRRVTDGELRRLMLFLPPRHGKSEMVTIRYAAWYLEQHPDKRVIIGAYNQTLADKFSRKVRKIVRERIELSTERTAVEDWETAAGGGLRAVGVGAGITGMGGDLIIIDDPVKNRKEANSLTYRDWVYDWYTDDLYTRQEPGAAIILIMTRWHEDDLAGRIKNSETGDDWEVISLPALAEEDDPLGRPLGEPLWLSRYDSDELRDRQRTLGRAFWGLFQQRPQEQEGGMFNRSDLRFIAADDMPDDTTWVWYFDKAATSKGGDYSAGVKMGRTPDKRYIVANVQHGQWDTKERDDLCLGLMRMDSDIPFYFEQEGGASGKDVTVYQTRIFTGYPVSFETVTGSKEVRAMPLAAQVKANNVYLVRAPWNEGYIGELTAFPNAANDDQVDASSGAFMKVIDGGISVLW